MTDTETAEKQAEDIELDTDEVLDQVAEYQNEEPGQEPASDAVADQAESEGEETETEGDEEEDEVVVEVEGETPDPEEEQEQHSNPNLVKDLRKQIKERNRRIKELEKKRKEEEAEENPALKPLRKKPTLADPGTGKESDSYDSEVYERELDKWKDEEAAHKSAKAEEETKQKQEQESWNKTVEQYNERKANFKAPDFDEVESELKESLDVRKQAMIVKYTSNPEVVTYAIGKRPELLKKLSEEKDLAQFLADVVNLSNKVSVKSRKVTTSPETRVTNATAPTNAGPDKKRQQLVAQADATGDFTALIEYDEKRKAALRKKK